MDSETVWRALASPHRRKLLDLLREGPQTTGQLTKEMSGLSRFAVMQHLGVLAEAGLVLFRKNGRQRFNYANPVPLREIYERWVNPISSSAAGTALHLKRYAETTRGGSNLTDQNEYRLVKIELEMRIRAPRDRVFAALTDEIDNWWPHRYKPDSSCYCETKVGGMIGEKFKAGGGAQYGSIVYLDPPYKISSTGPSSLGRGMDSFSTDTLTEEDGQTLVKREFLIWGSVPDDIEKMYREGSRQIMEEALNRYLEEGLRYSPEAPQ